MIDANEVERIFGDCLYRDEELKEGNPYPSGMVEVQGVLNRFGLHPGRLASHTEEISDMLDELPDSFRSLTGGGMSFLNACEDKHGEQWTSLHQRMDQLFVLGQGIGRVQCLLPRDLWAKLPGGMPYYMILERKTETA